MTTGPKECEKQGSERYHSADVNDRLIINLRDMGQTIRLLYEGKGSQKRILIILLEVGSITQRALTSRLGIQPGSASEVIAKLENAGLIQRTVSTDDRRTANIRLTPEGEHLAKAAAEDRLAAQGNVFLPQRFGETDPSRLDGKNLHRLGCQIHQKTRGRTKCGSMLNDICILLF